MSDDMCPFQDFADTHELVHGGIYASAMWLKDRLLCLSQVRWSKKHVAAIPSLRGQGPHMLTHVAIF